MTDEFADAAWPASQYGHPLGTLHATNLPCPPWCTLPPGHPLESVEIDTTDAPLRLVGTDDPDPGSLFRVHRHRLGTRETHITVEAYERPATAQGPTDLGADADAFLVRIQLPNSHGHVTAAGARRLADLLTHAADILDASEPQR